MFRNFWNSLKIISASSVILSGSFFIPNDAAMAGGFAETCARFKTVKDNGNIYLTADCRRRDGVYVSSRINLSDLIVNNRGNLAWQRGGGFQGSCIDLKVPYFGAVKGDFVFSALCADGMTFYNRSFLNLNERISNQNGQLAPDF